MSVCGNWWEQKSRCGSWELSSGLGEQEVLASLVAHTLTLVNICHGRSFNKGIPNHWLEIQKINSSILYLIVVYQSLKNIVS